MRQIAQGGRRASLALCCLGLVLVLAACTPFSHAHDIQSTVLMGTLGVDVGTESVDGVAVTASSSARPGAGTQQGEEAVILSAQADTISAACRKMEGMGDRFVFYGDVEQLLVGEGQAARSLGTVLTHVGRDRALRLEAQVWCVRGGSAADVLFSDAQGAGERLAAMQEDAGLFSAALPKSAREALVELSENGCTFVPGLTVAPSRPGDGTQGETTILPAGYALIQEGTLVGWTDPEASRGVNLLLGQVDTDVLELVAPDCSRVALEITGASTGYAPHVEEGRLVGLTVTCRIEADVAERRGNCILNVETLRWMEEALAGRTQARLAAAMAQLQELDADCLGLGARAALAAPWHKVVMEEQWQGAFDTLPVEFAVTAKVARE